MRYLIAPVIGLSLIGDTPAIARSTASYWSTFDATQRLETGRFAARNDVDASTCVGIGTLHKGQFGEKQYRGFDCAVWAKGFERKRQLTLRVTGPTTFRVTWLKPQVCTPAP